jgi:hypothetical protein
MNSIHELLRVREVTEVDIELNRQHGWYWLSWRMMRSMTRRSLMPEERVRSRTRSPACAQLWSPRISRS